jgi:hypothetical protein
MRRWIWRGLTEGMTMAELPDLADKVAEAPQCKRRG